MEMQLLIPAHTAVARVYVGLEKAFLRLAEFPPDANRGFDLPAALLLLPPPRLLQFIRNRGGGGEGGGGEGEGTESGGAAPGNGADGTGGVGGGDGGRGRGGGLPPQYSPLLDAVEGLGPPPGDGRRWGNYEDSSSDFSSHSPEVIYMGGLLLPLPTPDFSMPFNIITMVGARGQSCPISTAAQLIPYTCHLPVRGPEFKISGSRAQGSGRTARPIKVDFLGFWA